MARKKFAAKRAAFMSFNVTYEDGIGWSTATSRNGAMFCRGSTGRSNLAVRW